MKKAFYALLTLLLGTAIALFVYQTLRTVSYVKDHGREGVLVIDANYHTDSWSRPLPLKKLHAYTATLEPRHEVVVKTDQELAEHSAYSIVFLTRDKTNIVRNAFLRPIAGSVRLRTPDDPKPASRSSTDRFDRMLSKAMGSQHDTSPASTRPAPSGLQISDGAVPFLIVPEGAGFFQLLWANSRPGEWLFVLLASLLFIALARNTWRLPWGRTVPPSERKDFLHPSLRTIDPDPPAPKPTIGFSPGISRMEQPPPLPPSASGEGHKEPVLKLRKK